jgi:hypothetical protein
VEWGDLSLEFRNGVFDGYRYRLGGLPGTSVTTVPPGPGEPLLKTATGATLGMTLAQVRPLYPSLSVSGDQGGSIEIWAANYDRLFLGFFENTATAVLSEIKGGQTCGDV